MPPQTAFAVLGAISFCHLLNDMMQALLPAMYPMLKTDFGLDFAQIGLHHLHLPADRFAAAAGDRRVYRSPAQAVFA